MIELIGPFNSGDAVGSLGSALSNQDSAAHVAGLLEAVFLRYNPDYPDNPPGTTKVTITTKGANGSPPTRTILTLDNANTDGWFQPRRFDPPTGRLSGFIERLGSFTHDGSKT